MAHSHCTGSGQGTRLGNDGFLYYAVHTTQGQGAIVVYCSGESQCWGGGSRDACPSPASKFFQFDAVFRKIWQNHTCWPPESWRPRPGEILNPPPYCAYPGPCPSPGPAQCVWTISLFYLQWTCYVIAYTPLLQSSLLLYCSMWRKETH